MKKLILIIILNLIINVPLISAMQNENYREDNIEFSEYSMDIPLTKEMISNVNILHINQVPLPASFSWKNKDNKDWTTPAKYQGNCGSCWDFAAIGTLESIIKIRENRSELNPDLSEQYVLSCLPAAANNYGLGCLGGTPYKAFYYMMDDGIQGNNYNGALPEDCFNYQANDQISCNAKCNDWQNQLIPIADCGEQWIGFDSEENRNYVKSMIYEIGPIATGINVSEEMVQWGNWHHSETDYFNDPNMPWGNRLNHIIVLVGWHDDEQISNGGYWICKNSWGKDWGYDGFFNIEYGALFTATYISWVDYIPSDNNRPYKPEKPIGNQQGSMNEEYTYIFVSSDPDNDTISYCVDWGDDTDFNWIGPFNSGKTIELSHTWNNKGSYEIRVKVKDSHGSESQWSDPLHISMPHIKNIIFYHIQNFLIYRLYSFQQLFEEILDQFK